MQFKKYGSIENLSLTKFVNSVIYNFPNVTNIRFVVLEKAHGSHFSFQTDGVNITCAKRSSIIANNENFYNHLDLLENYKERIMLLFKTILNKYHNTIGIQIDGEIIGGCYPHVDVKSLNLPKVQKGVYYCPDYRFYAYDVVMFDKDNNSLFLNYDVCIELFKECNFYYAKPLFDGSLKDAMLFNPEFQTTLPKDFGFPEIIGNFAEGVVIKPVEALIMPNGSRVIFKNKNDKFNETQIKVEDKSLHFVDDIPDHIKEVAENMMLMITENRLDNVISKIGEVTKKDEGKLIGLLSKDILDEFEKLYGETWSSIVKNEQKIVTKKLSNQCRILISNYFINQ